jgi:hypothetical protein
MIGDNDKKDETDVDESEDEILDEENDVSEDKMPDIGGDTIIDLSQELEVEQLVSKLEAANPDEIAHKREIRRRLDEIAEKRNQDLDSTFNFDLDDDL